MQNKSIHHPSCPKPYISQIILKETAYTVKLPNLQINSEFIKFNTFLFLIEKSMRNKKKY